MMTVVLVGDPQQKFGPLVEKLKAEKIHALINEPIPEGAMAFLCVSALEGVSTGTFQALEEFSGHSLSFAAVIITEMDDSIDTISWSAVTRELEKMLPAMISRQVEKIPTMQGNDPYLIQRIRALHADESKPMAVMMPKKFKKEAALKKYRIALIALGATAVVSIGIWVGLPMLLPPPPPPPPLVNKHKSFPTGTKVAPLPTVSELAQMKPMTDTSPESEVPVESGGGAAPSSEDDKLTYSGPSTKIHLEKFVPKPGQTNMPWLSFYLLNVETNNLTFTTSDGSQFQGFVSNELVEFPVPIPAGPPAQMYFRVTGTNIQKESVDILGRYYVGATAADGRTELIMLLGTNVVRMTGERVSETK